MLDCDALGMVEDPLANEDGHELSGGGRVSVACLARERSPPLRAELADGPHCRLRIGHANAHHRFVAVDDADDLIDWNERLVVEHVDADLGIAKGFERQRKIELLDQPNVTALPCWIEAT